MTPDPLPLLREIVAIPSCDPPGGELAVAQVVHRHLLGLGLDSTLDAFLPGRANVVACLRGRGSRPPLVFSAHLDTVPVGDQAWRFDPFAGDVVGDRVRGRGTTDMKGAVAAFCAAAGVLAARGAPLGGDLILAFTAGESADCLGARRLAAQGFKARIGAFLCGEPSSLDLIVVEKAILWLEVRAVGRIGHVSGEAGVNAILLMSKALSRLCAITLDLPVHPLLSPPSVTVGTIRGGTAVNVTPDLCIAALDVRFGPGIAVETVLAQLAPLLPDGVTLHVTDFKAAVEEPPDSPFVRLCADAVAGITGRPPAVRGVSYYSDGAILMQGVDAPFVILGPGELGLSGQPDETASVAALRAAVGIYVRIAEDWLGEAPPAGA